MDQTTKNKYVTVAYKLFTKNDKGITELVEEAPAEHPYQFITDMGITLDAFEEKVKDLNSGDKFDFTLSVDQAYGPYEEEHVIDLDKKLFCVNGHFDKEGIFPGNVIPLINEDGQRFQGLVLEVGDDKVTVDLNHPLAGKELHFEGTVVTSRPATAEEIQGMANMMSGEECGCGCGCEDGEGDCCHHHHEGKGDDHHCCGGHCH